jgi:hypothetical protein
MATQTKILPDVKLKTFYYKNDLYIRVIPAKSLFNSTLVHEVINRGDIFAIRVSDSHLTIVPGKAQVTHSVLDVYEPLKLVPVVIQQDLFGDTI